MTAGPAWAINKDQENNNHRECVMSLFTVDVMTLLVLYISLPCRLILAHPLNISQFYGITIIALTCAILKWQKKKKNFSNKIYFISKNIWE